MSSLSQPVDGNDHIEGNPNAAAVVVEYGDYQCPYCGEAYPTLQEVVREMGDQICFVFRNFPLTEMHPNALRAAQFAEAAASVGKFWFAHDLLYENQDALGEEDLYGYALQIGMPVSLLSKAFAGHFDRKITSDFNSGVRSGVNGTPSLFINGRRYDGDRDVGSIVDAIKMAISYQAAL